MTKKNNFFRKGNIAELMEWTRLIFGDAELQREITSREIPREKAEGFISGRAAYEAQVFIGRKIIKELETKVTAWEKILKSLPDEETTKA